MQKQKMKLAGSWKKLEERRNEKRGARDLLGLQIFTIFTMPITKGGK